MNIDSYRELLDALALPFADGIFDAVLGQFGVSRQE